MPECSVPRINSLAMVSRGGPQVEEASLSILPDAAKFVFRGGSSSLSTLGGAFGLELPRTVNRFNESGKRRAYCLGPDEWLLEAGNEDPVSLWCELSASLADDACSLVDVSHRSDGIEISGTKSEYILNHGCPLDLSAKEFPVGMCTRTVLGKSSLILSRTDQTVFCLDIWRSFSTYVWSLLDEARQEFLPRSASS